MKLLISVLTAALTSGTISLLIGMFVGVWLQVILFLPIVVFAVWLGNKAAAKWEGE